MQRELGKKNKKEKHILDMDLWIFVECRQPLFDLNMCDPPSTSLLLFFSTPPFPFPSRSHETGVMHP